jgi:hypothetical protein
MNLLEQEETYTGIVAAMSSGSWKETTTLAISTKLLMEEEGKILFVGIS